VAALAAFAGASCKREEAALVSRAVAPVGPEVWAYVVIPSLEQAISDVSEVAERFAPGEMTPGSLRAQIGGLLQDPQLANLDTRKPILVCALQSETGGPPLSVALVPAKQAAPYEQTLAGLGMKTRFSGGLLVIAQTPEGLEASAKARTLYEQVGGSGSESTARIYVHVARLLDTFGPLLEAQLDGLLGSFAAKIAAAGAGGGGPGASPETLQKLLKLEVRAVLALLRQVENTQVDLDLGRRVIAVDQVVTARPGSTLAAGFTSSAAHPASATSVIPGGGGLLAGTLRLDSKGFSPFFQQLAETLAQESEGLFPREAVALWSNVERWWGGAGSFRLRRASRGVAVAYVLDVPDEAGFLELMEKSLALFSPGSGLGNLYKEMGIPLEMRIEKAVRQYRGTSIHRFNMSLSPPEKEAGEQKGLDQAFLGTWLKDLEIGFVKGTGLYASDPAELDRMIDQVQSSGAREVHYESRKVFGAGGHGYLDYDMFGLLKTFLVAMPEGQPKAEMTAAFNRVTAKDPMLFALVFGEARARLRAQVPLDPIAQMANTSR
jgi:hypothetical protein